uniref:DUF5123 domain-containing protein n=1 Tax=Bacteroides stercoris TaxID=46506 RepID=UPI00356864CD
MKTIYITLRTLVCMLCLTGIFTACTEGNEWETNPSKAALFRVRDVKVDKAAAQTASVSWSATSSAEYYIIEVSTEKLSDNMEMGTAQNSIVYGEDKSISTVPALISGLTKSSTYYLRVKSFGDGLESGWAYLDGTFETTEEDILEKEFANGDITAESIRVKWNDAGLPVTHLSYEWQVNVGGDVTIQEETYELSSEEISAQSAILSGLQPGTKYNISIYNNDDLRGITEATTEQIFSTPEVLGGNITLKWNTNSVNVTKLSYHPNNVEEAETTEYELTETEINASSITLTGLDLGTEYTFMIYNEEALRGIATATTEQIMNITTENIRGKSVTVTWADNGTAATKLTYQPANAPETVWNNELSAEGTNVTGLEGETTYTFRIYTDDVLRGEQTVTTLKELIDVTIEAGITSATFTWEVDETVASYACTKDGEVAQTIPLAEDNKNKGAITVDNLIGSTKYTFTLYNIDGIAVSNEQIFTTKTDPLKDYKKIYLNSKDEWNNIWNDENNSGKIAIILTPQTDYDMSGSSTKNIPQRITSLVVWGGEDGKELSEEDKPIIGFRGLSFEASSIDEITFFNVAIKCDNSTGNILFRQVSPTTIRKLTFQSCKIYDTRGFIVHDKNVTGTTQSLTIDNCYFENIGDYSIIGNRNGHTINNISFTNSTVNNCSGNIIRVNQTTNFILTIDHCTFYNCGAGSTQWIRSDAENDNIVISNSLFTSLHIRTQSDGICNTLKNTCNKANIFYTNDCTGDNYANYWSTKLNYSSTELFENPSGGNFRVQIPEYAIYGDPRWNK